MHVPGPAYGGPRRPGLASVMEIFKLTSSNSNSVFQTHDSESERVKGLDFTEKPVVTGECDGRPPGPARRPTCGQQQPKRHRGRCLAHPKMRVVRHARYACKDLKLGRGLRVRFEKCCFSSGRPGPKAHDGRPAKATAEPRLACRSKQGPPARRRANLTQHREDSERQQHSAPTADHTVTGRRTGTPQPD